MCLLLDIACLFAQVRNQMFHMAVVPPPLPPEIVLPDFQELFKNPSAVQAVELAAMLRQRHILI